MREAVLIRIRAGPENGLPRRLREGPDLVPGDGCARLLGPEDGRGPGDGHVVAASLEARCEGKETGTRGGLDQKTSEGQETGPRGGFAKGPSEDQETGARGLLDQKTDESQETGTRGGFAKDESESQKTGARGGLGQ